MAHVQFGDSAYYDNLLKIAFVKRYSTNGLDKMLQKITAMPASRAPCMLIPMLGGLVA
jgi:hypothetical protein